MFSLEVVDTDVFLDMPNSAQALYFHLGMRADDDGFVSSPRRITAMVNASLDDFKLLVTKQFIIPFDSGVCVVKDWKINNYLRGDRYQPTRYTEEFAQLTETDRIYKLAGSCQSVGIPNVNQMPVKVDTQYRIEKNSTEKNSIKADKPPAPARFVKPTVEEVEAYCIEQGLNLNAHNFVDYYDSVGWVVGKNKPMKDWKATARRWTRGEKKQGAPARSVTVTNESFSPDDFGFSLPGGV